MDTMYDNSFSKNKIHVQYDQLFLQSKIILQTNVAVHGATNDGVKNLSDVYFTHTAYKICTRIILQNFVCTLYVITCVY